jgi:hypothetical protein
MRNRRNAYWVLVGRPKGKRTLKDLSVDGRIISKWIFRRGMGRH